MSESVISQNNNSLVDNLSATEPTVNPKQNDIKDNGAQEVEESSPAKKIKLSNVVNDEVVTPAPGRAGRPSKAATARRLNILEKTAKEGEALLQNMGHKSDENPESNRRTTRSQTRGTPPVPPTPPKKEKATPKTPSKDNTPSSGGPKRRGRPPKNSVTNNSVENKTEVKTNSEQKTEKSEPNTEEKINKESQQKVNNSNETNNNTTNDVNPSEESNSAEEKPTKDAVDAKPTKEVVTEQTNDLSAKTNSISDDTSKSVPVLDTQQSTKD